MLLKKLVAALVEKKRERKRRFIKNGGLVLETLVASCNGRPIPIRTFSYKELLLATNNFDPRLILDPFFGHGQMYKGSFEGRILFIKCFKVYDEGKMNLALMDLGISAKMSAHNNILHLAGCCLETSIPSLVFEYAQNGVLSNQIYISQRQGTSMVWQSRLKIARQIAHAIAYLHTGFSRPIIHRDIKSENILLDQHYVPKLVNFENSISIPEGETYVEDSVVGTVGFLCPNYFSTNRITEKTDVYGFGMVLLEILTGKSPYHLLEADESPNLAYIRNRAIDEIVDPAILAEDGGAGLEPRLQAVLRLALTCKLSSAKIVDPAILAEDGGAGLEPQLQAVLRLALTCIEVDPEIRPTMVDVTKELRRIERSIG